MGAFRYPGAKSKIAEQIVRAFPSSFRDGPLFGRARYPLDYREPFFGAGGIGLKVIASLPPQSHVWINDADHGIANYWRAVVSSPDELRALIQACQPTVPRYRECLAQAADPALNVVESAFATLFVHQCSYSGLGKMAGSPIGGWKQEEGETPKRYDVSCRWKPKKLLADITHWHRVFQAHHMRVTCGDFAEVFAEVQHPATTFFYCDPPYVQRGPVLYSQSMTPADHARLAAQLHALRSPWVLSYDDDPLVRQLYHDCRLEPLAVRYIVAQGSADGSKAPVGHELLITALPRARWSIVVPGRTGYHYQDLARTSGLPATTIRNRVRRGWPLEQAITQPLRQKSVEDAVRGVTP